jgi:hypothetical protein
MIYNFYLGSNEIERSRGYSKRVLNYFIKDYFFKN